MGIFSKSGKKPKYNIFRATVNTWDEEVLRASELVLIEFWTMGCDPCRGMVPVIEELSEEYPGKLKIVKVNKDENPELSEKYKIVAVPSFLFFKGGERLDKIVGVLTKDELKKNINAFLFNQ